MPLLIWCIADWLTVQPSAVWWCHSLVCQSISLEMEWGRGQAEFNQVEVSFLQRGPDFPMICFGEFQSTYY